VRIVLAALALLAAGCPALLTKSAPAEIRYFTPEGVAAPGPAAAADDPAPELQLRLARVNAASYIEDRIAFRDAGAEVGYYRDRRWADPPESYLRRALSRALFEERRLREIVSGRGPSLEVELHVFEELRAPRHVARIAITWRLRGDRTVLVQRTVTVEHPIAAGAPDDEAAAAIAAAMAIALGDLVDRVVPDVVSRLGAEPPIEGPLRCNAP